MHFRYYQNFMFYSSKVFCPNRFFRLFESKVSLGENSPRSYNHVLSAAVRSDFDKLQDIESS